MIKCNERKILCFLLFEFGERGNKGWNGRHAAVLGNPTSEGQAGERGEAHDGQEEGRGMVKMSYF